MRVKFIKCFLVLTFLIVSFSSKLHAVSIQYIGDMLQYIIPAYALGMSVNEKDIEGAQQMVFSFGVTQLTVNSIKLIVPERRPDGTDKHSFPSAHTASAFSGASFIHKRYGLMQASVPYVLAAFVGFSRVYAKRHWTHDVLAGATISCLVSYFMVSKYVDITIEMGQKKREVGFIYRF